MKDESLQQQQSLEQYEQQLREQAQTGNPVAKFQLVDHFERKAKAPNMLEAQTRINLLMDASNQNVGVASLLLGQWYLTGHYVTQDTAKAILFFEHAAAQGKEPAGFYRLAEMFDRGIGLPANADKAAQYLKKASAMGYPDAIFTSATHLLDTNINQAFELLKDNYKKHSHIRSLFLLNDDSRFNRSKVLNILQQSSQEEPFAASLLAAHLFNKGDLNQAKALLDFAMQYQNPIAYYVASLLSDALGQTEQAQQHLAVAASLGHVEAAHRSALYLANQIDHLDSEDQRQQTLQQMLKLFAQAAQEGFAPAQFSLAQCWLQGIGLEKNVEEAVGWLDRAAQQGHIEAMFTLALNLPTDHPQHLPLFQAAAQSGHRKAHLCIGMYYQNQGQPEKSLEWFNKAKTLGDSRADYFLGQAYLHGAGVEADAKQAMEYFKTASDAGDADAHFALYEAYKEGVGLRRNKKSQAKYLKLAQTAGHEEALTVIE